MQGNLFAPVHFIRVIITFCDVESLPLLFYNKNVTIIASVLTLGVSGAVCDFGVVSIGTTALAMLVGIILNLILKNKKEK